LNNFGLLITGFFPIKITIFTGLNSIACSADIDCPSQKCITATGFCDPDIIEYPNLRINQVPFFNTDKTPLPDQLDLKKNVGELIDKDLEANSFKDNDTFLGENFISDKKLKYEMKCFETLDNSVSPSNGSVDES
jgi:hypothetical protein